jgi:hypothetical protein
MLWRMVQLAGIERDGFAIARGLLSSNEVERLGTSLTAHFATKGRIEGLGKYQPDAAVEIEGIAWIFPHPGIISCFRQILGGRTPVFTGNCDAHQNMLSWWHKDADAASNLDEDFFAKPSCGLYRAGIYLQDHQGNRDGLTVRRGSHQIKALEQGVCEYLDTQVGDVVFFDIRLTHAGKFADPFEYFLYRAARLLRRNAEAARIRQWYWRIARKRQKQSLFFTFGGESRVLDNFCAMEQRERKLRSPLASQYLSPELIRDLKSAGAACPSAMVQDRSIHEQRPFDR